MSAPTGREVVVKVLEDEGGKPGHSIHSWRCEYPDRFGPCDCLDQVASEILTRLAERGYRPPPDAKAER